MALGDAFPLEFDLNAVTEAELAQTPSVTSAQVKTILAQLETRPLLSLGDFEKRTGLQARHLGLTAVAVGP